MSEPPRSDLVAAFEDAFYGNKKIELKVISWRQFLHGANRANKEDVDDHRLELYCCLQQGLFAGEVTIGETQSEDLRNVDYLIEIRCSQKAFADLETVNPGSEVGKDVQGLLRYDDAPNSTDHFIGLPQGAHNASKTAKGWVYFGIDTVREISRLLTLQPQSEIHIGLTVKATATPSPNSLTYKTEPYPPTYHWDAKEVLGITEAVVVVTKAPVTTPERRQSMMSLFWRQIGGRR